MSIVRSYLGIPILYKIGAGFVLGVIAGALAGAIIGPEAFDPLRPLGDLFVRLLKMLVAPIVLLSLVVGSASISPGRLGRIGVKVFVYYIITTTIAITIGLIIANLVRPGRGLTLAEEAGEVTVREVPPISQLLLEIVPTNPFESLAEGKVLQIMFFAIIFGIALAFLRESRDERVRSAADSLFRIIDGAAEAIYLIVRGVLEYAPIGVFALIGFVVARYGPGVLGPLAIVVLALYLGLLIQIVVVYGAVLRAVGLSLVKFIRGIIDAMITAFVTRSSGATLPVSMRVAEENLGVRRTVYSFTLPFGANVNLDGTAMYIAISVFFIATVLNTPLTISQQLLLLLVATLASIGTAPVPGAGLIMLGFTLEAVGLPLTEPLVAAAYGMIAGIDVILDSGRTMTNVTGDLAGTTLVAATEGEIVLESGVWAS